MKKVINSILSFFFKELDPFDKEYGFLLKHKIVDKKSYNRVKAYFFLCRHKSE